MPWRGEIDEVTAAVRAARKDCIVFVSHLLCHVRRAITDHSGNAAIIGGVGA